MNKRIKYLIPFFIRRYLITLYQRLFWPFYFRIYLKTVEKGEIPQRKLIQKLIDTWGNQGFSAKIDFCETIVETGYKADKLIFECGSGLSTLLLGAIAKKNNVKIISLEHMSFWAEKIQKELSKYKLMNNEVLVRPLVNYGDFFWYESDDILLPDIGLCVCDAPPGSTFGGRKGFLYKFKDNLKKGACILVDDTSREAEKEMIEEWENLLSFTVDFKGPNKSYAVLEVV